MKGPFRGSATNELLIFEASEYVAIRMEDRAVRGCNCRMSYFDPDEAEAIAQALIDSARVVRASNAQRAAAAHSDNQERNQ